MRWSERATRDCMAWVKGPGFVSAGRFHPSVAQGIQKDIQFTADVYPVGFGRYLSL